MVAASQFPDAEEMHRRRLQRAVLQLGQRDGFYADDALRIRAPGQLRKLTDTARQLGAGRKVDEFELAMNRAAEKAVPLAADVFADAVRQMTVRDAHVICDRLEMAVHAAVPGTRVALFAAVMWTVLTTKEYSPEELARFEAARGRIAGSAAAVVQRSAAQFASGGMVWIIAGAAPSGAASVT